MTTSDRRAERATTFGDRLRPRNWSLPVRLIAVLLVPTLLVLGLGALRIMDQARASESLNQAERYVAAQEGVDALLGQLQSERDQSAVFVAGERSGDPARLRAQAFAQTDAVAEELRRLLEGAAPLPETVAASAAATEESLRKLPELRTQVVDARPIAPGEVIKQYTAITQPVLLLHGSLARQLQTADVAQLAAGLSALASIQEQIAQQHALIATGIIDVRLPPADIDQVRAADARLAVAIDDMRVAPTPEQQAAYGAFLTGTNFGQFQPLKQAALTRAAANQPVGITAADWDGAYGRVSSDINTSETGMRGEVKAASSVTQDQASTLAIASLAVLLLALVVGLTIAILVGRTLLKSLRTLRRSALDVAERRLPQAVDSMRSGEVPDITIQPVPVTSHEEVGQVARAFDAVHGQAVRLAAEQATLQSNVSSMFVNLSRRSQGLVERQLQLIEQLESNEEDPEQLSNLFQLDHLATRMRRNSENLLVLAGSDLARRGGQPVPVVDVLRAAVSEVEQYQRIVVQPPPPVRVLGRAASDLVHLLAELLDNATIYSAPESQVVMSSSRAEDGSVLVEIADRGIGMSEQDLADANARLNGPPNVDVSAARRMGLFVVGRLAARHGVAVHLTGSSGPGPGAGVTASVTVPNYLVTRGDALIPEAPAGLGPRAGAVDRQVTVPPPRPPGNGASRGGPYSPLHAEGSPRPANGLANGYGQDGPEPDGGPPAPTEGVPRGGSPVPAQAGGGPGDGQGRPYAAGAPGAGRHAGAGPSGAGPGGSGPSGTGPSGTGAALFGAGAVSAGTGRPRPVSTGTRPPGTRPPAADPAGTEHAATESAAPSAPPSAWAGGPSAPPMASPPDAEPAAPVDAPPTEAFGVGAAEPAQSTAAEREAGPDAPPSSVEPAALGAPPVPRTDPQSVPLPEPPPLPADESPTPPEPSQGWPTLGQQPPAAEAQQAPMVPGGPVPAGRADALGFVAPPMAPQDGTETTPIFEEIASAWFRSKRPVPVEWQGDQEPTQRQAPADGADRPSGPTDGAGAAPEATDGAGAAPEATAETPEATAETPAPDPATEATTGPAVAERPAEPSTPAAAAAAPERTEPDRQASPEQVSTVDVESAQPSETAAAAPAPEAAGHPASETATTPAATDEPEPAEPIEPAAPAAAGAALSAYASAPPERPRAPEQQAQPEPVAQPEQRAPEPEPQPEYQQPPPPQQAPEPQAEPVSAARSEHPAQLDRPRPGPRAEPAPDVDRETPPERPPAQQRRAPGVVIPSLQPIKPPEPHWPERRHEPAGFGPVSRDFAGPADAGWQAAQALGDPEPDGEQPEERTSAGLPKRKPRARLVPGSAEASTSDEQPRRPSRTAEQVRGRLARYQAGIRQGREDRHRLPDNPAQVTDEEQQR